MQYVPKLYPITLFARQSSKYKNRGIRKEFGVDTGANFANRVSSNFSLEAIASVRIVTPDKVRSDPVVEAQYMSEGANNAYSIAFTKGLDK